MGQHHQHQINHGPVNGKQKILWKKGPELMGHSPSKQTKSARQLDMAVWGFSVYQVPVPTRVQQVARAACFPESHMGHKQWLCIKHFLRVIYAAPHLPSHLVD
jgi:hypothetical protein